MIEKLKTLKISTYPRIWCSLNIMEFPIELIEHKPKNWDLIPIEMKHKYIKEPFKYIQTIISEKELLREWNKERYVGIDFDIWWENRKSLSEKEIKILKLLYKNETSILN